MNYIWEVLLEADREGISRESIRFLMSANPSPYLEAAFEDINTAEIEDSYIEVNPLYRFSEVFSRLCDVNLSAMPEIREIFLDVSLHYIAQLDLRSGMDRQDFYLRFIEKDMEQGAYGGKACNAVKLFSAEEQRIWQRGLLHLYRARNYREIFRKVIRGIYKNALMYENNDRNNELLLYLGIEESEKEEQRIGFLIDMFLPLQDNVFLYYMNHFGIIGIEETMRIDEVIIF